MVSQHSCVLHEYLVLFRPWSSSGQWLLQLLGHYIHRFGAALDNFPTASLGPILLDEESHVGKCHHHQPESQPQPEHEHQLVVHQRHSA